MENNEVTITDYTGTATEITIPDKIGDMPVTAIGHYAFSHRSLTSIIIPKSVTSISSTAFYLCENLANITVDEKNPWFIIENGELYKKN